MTATTPISGKNGVIKVLVSDNTPMGAELLAGTLKRDRRFNVVGAVSTPDVISNAAREHQPDVVLLTLQREDLLTRFKTARELRAAYPNLRVVIILDSSERELVIEAFRAGAKGVLCRNTSVKSLGKCLECVHQGQIWATCLEMQFVVEALVECPPIRPTNSMGTSLLSKQEQAVVNWMTEGLSNREIATQLKLSEHTVKNYIFRIFDKLGVSKRVEVILYALSQRGESRAISVSPRGHSIATDRLLFQWCRTQAEQGCAPAGLILAGMYQEGRGTEQDRVSAYAWFFSVEFNSEEFREASRLACENLAKSMTQEEIAAAVTLAVDFPGSKANRQDSPDRESTLRGSSINGEALDMVADPVVVKPNRPARYSRVGVRTPART